MYFGKSTLPLKEDHMITLPENFRNRMGKRAFLTPGFDQNLLILPEEVFAGLCARLQSVSISDPSARLLKRLLLGGAVEVDMDGRGQVSIPEELSAFAALGNEVVLVGQGDYAELWASASWDKVAETLNDTAANARRFENIDLSPA